MIRLIHFSSHEWGSFSTSSALIEGLSGRVIFGGHELLIKVVVGHLESEGVKILEELFVHGVLTDVSTREVHDGSDSAVVEVVDPYSEGPPNASLSALKGHQVF
jgi:hypothetical protein